ncbi:MAG: hypothetical protein U0136_01885 [Bdellovibrionota bacterium]
MSVDLFSTLPADSKVWVFALSTSLAETDRPAIEKALKEFTGQWKAHGKSVAGDGTLMYDRFLIIAADPNVSEVSGCSIDSMFRGVKAIVNSVGADLADFAQIYYRDGESIESVTRAAFKDLKQKGVVHDGTIVFDNSVTSLALLKSGKWELPLAESWHARL